MALPLLYTRRSPSCVRRSIHPDPDAPSIRFSSVLKERLYGAGGQIPHSVVLFSSLLQFTASWSTVSFRPFNLAFSPKTLHSSQKEIVERAKVVPEDFALVAAQSLVCSLSLWPRTRPKCRASVQHCPYVSVLLVVVVTRLHCNTIKFPQCYTCAETMEE